MPPAVEFEEELNLLKEEEEHEHQDASSSDSDEVIELDSPIDVDFPEETFYSQQLAQLPPEPQQEHQEQPQREASPVPIVVSDIVQKNVATLQTAVAPLLKSGPTKPPKVKMKTVDKGSKRPLDFKSNHMPIAKRRKGSRRDTPCVYCVRRLANDPKWACHDALVGQNGLVPYVGTRCNECVGAHVSCHLIPDKAIEAVDKLSKAAADAVASDGTDRIALLAAYEAAIGPALRAIIVVPASSDAAAEKRKPGRKPNSNKSHPGPRPTQWTTKPSKRTTASGLTAWEAAAAEPSTSFASSSAGYQQQQQRHQQQQYADPASFFAPPPQQNGGDADYDRRETQALRRRKVEALESISHTAALFLAEFMTFTKQQRQNSASVSGGGGEGNGYGGGQNMGEGGASAQNHGVNYAAAAAGMAASMFQPFADGNNDDDDSDSDSSDASTIENNVHDSAPYQSFTAASEAVSVQGENHPHPGGDSGGLEATFGSDVQVDEDESARASTKREGESEGEEREQSEVKIEDG